MTHFRRTVLWLMALAPAACGTQTYAGDAGTCTKTNTFSHGQTLVFCQEFAWSEQARINPATTIGQTLQSECSNSTATTVDTFQPQGSCPLSGAYAKCVSTGTTDGASVTVTTIMSGSAATDQTSEDYCSQLAGTYTKL